MLSLSRLALVMTLSIAIAAFILLIQDVAPRNRSTVDRSAAEPADVMKIVPAEADQDRRQWRTGHASAH